MKTKKFGRKLALNKKTIGNLSNVQLGKVRGGESGFQTGCCQTVITICVCTFYTCNTCAGLTCDDKITCPCPSP